MTTKKVNTKTKSSKQSKTKRKGVATVKVDDLKVRASPPRRRVEPDELYRATFESAEVKESRSNIGDNDKYLQLQFKLTKHSMNTLENSDDSADGMPIYAQVSLPITVGSKSSKIIAGIIGKEVDVDDNINLKAHYGKTYKVLIVDKKSKDEEGRPWQKVDSVKQIAKKNKKSSE